MVNERDKVAVSTLTREQILAMSAGPDLDALVAKLVMGCRPEKGSDGNWYCGCAYSSEIAGWPHGQWYEACEHSDLARYSTEIDAAWKVVEKLGRHVALLVEPVEMIGRAGGREIRHKGRTRCSVVGCHPPSPLWAETTPLAICRAALLIHLQEQP